MEKPTNKPLSSVDYNYNECSTPSTKPIVYCNNMSATSPQELDALAAIIFQAQGRGQATAAPTPHAVFGNRIPASIGPNVSGLLALYQQQQQQRDQQQYIQQQVTGLQQADAEALFSLPPHLLQAYLCSQPKIGQALQSALAVGGGQYAAAPQPATATFPDHDVAVEQQQQAAQLQMIAAQLLVTKNGQMPPSPQPLTTGEPA